MTNGNADVQVYPISVPVHSGLKTVNFFLFKHKQSLSLIDAGYNNEECWGALQTTLNANNFCLQDISEIILTHHHIDHIGLVNRISAQHPIPVYASPYSIPRLKRDQGFLEMRIDFFANLYKEHGCGIEGEQQVSILQKAIQTNRHQAIQIDNLEVITGSQLLHFFIIDIPGHAPDQLAFWDEENKWLFSGDLLLPHISSNALVEPDQSGKRLRTIGQHIRSLIRCDELNAEIVFPGHGSVIKNANELINKRLVRIEQKGIKLLLYIQSGIQTASALAQAFYGEKYFKQFPLVMSEIIGHLDYLEDTNKLTKELENGVWHYFIK